LLFVDERENELEAAWFFLFVGEGGGGLSDTVGELIEMRLVEGKRRRKELAISFYFLDYVQR